SRNTRQAVPSSGTLSSVMHRAAAWRSNVVASRLLASARKLALDGASRVWGCMPQKSSLGAPCVFPLRKPPGYGTNPDRWPEMPGRGLNNHCEGAGKTPGRHANATGALSAQGRLRRMHRQVEGSSLV